MASLLFLTVVVSFIGVECHVSVPINNLVCQIAFGSKQRVTFVHMENTDEELVRCLSSAYIPLFTVGSESENQIRNCSSMDILTIAGGTRENILTQIGTILGWTTRRKHISKYILIFKEKCKELLEPVFRFFWKNGFLNVVALCRGNQRIYTYEPFTADGFKVVRLSQVVDPFYDKLRNLHHYQIRASQFYDPIRSLPMANNSGFRGIDGLLGKTIVQHLNATVQIVVPSNDELYGSEVNGSLNGALKHVATGLTHVAWNIRYIDEIHNRLVEALYPVGKRFFLHLVVPKASLVPQYSNFIRVFNTLTWWALLLNFFLVAVAFALMQQMVMRLPFANRNSRIPFRNILGMFFKTAIGDPVEGFHRISSLRQYLIAWILFCYVITSIYFAKMESVFIHPEYEQDIDSLSEMSRLKVPIYSHVNFLKAIKPSLDPKLYEILLSKHRFLPQNYEPQVQALTKGSNNKYAFILRRERASFLITRTYDGQAKRPRYHLVKEYFISMPQTYIVTKGSPFLDKFERLMIRCFEHGLMKHWEVIAKAEDAIEPTNDDDDYYDTYEETADESDENENSKKKAIVLNMDILQGAFYLWLIGIGAAGLGFLIELGYWKWSEARRSRGMLDKFRL